MKNKNYSCESSDSSLMSITCVTSTSSCDECYSSTSKCTSSSSKHHYTSECEDLETPKFSSSCHETSSTSLCSSSTSECTTYCDKTSYVESSHCDDDKTLEKCEEEHHSTVECETDCSKKCHKLVKKYDCAKEELCAISDILVVLNFIKNKLVAVQPNVTCRNMECYDVCENIKWLECFIDTLFCVLRKNKSYKCIHVKECKVKNCCEYVDNRTYLVKFKYSTKHGYSYQTVPLVFEWSQLTNNTAKSYNAVLNMVVYQINKEITKYNAINTLPFICH